MVKVGMLEADCQSGFLPVRVQASQHLKQISLLFCNYFFPVILALGEQLEEPERQPAFQMAVQNAERIQCLVFTNI
jgi:hypothetical protein